MDDSLYLNIFKLPPTNETNNKDRSKDKIIKVKKSDNCNYNRLDVTQTTKFRNSALRPQKTIFLA